MCISVCVAGEVAFLFSPSCCCATIAMETEMLASLEGGGGGSEGVGVYVFGGEARKQSSDTANAELFRRSSRCSNPINLII